MSTGIHSFLPHGDRLPNSGTAYVVGALVAALLWFGIATQWAVPLQTAERLTFGLIGVAFLCQAWIGHARRPTS